MDCIQASDFLHKALLYFPYLYSFGATIACTCMRYLCILHQNTLYTYMCLKVFVMYKYM